MSNIKNILLKKKSCKSVWFMRQAGRYLPEFKKIRTDNPNFIELCLNSKLQYKLQHHLAYHPLYHNSMREE